MMPRPRCASIPWHSMLVVCYCCVLRVAGQCVMVDKVDFQGSDIGSNPVNTPPIADFDECKNYCLGQDDCTAAEFRFGLICLVWDSDPQQTAEAGHTIALKVCTPDPAGSNSSSLMPSEGTNMTEQSTSSDATVMTAESARPSSLDLLPSETTVILQTTSSYIASTSSVVCVHELREITEPADDVVLDGGPAFADNVFNEEGWTSTTAGGDTLSITFTEDGEKTLQLLSFVVKSGNGTELIIEIETSSGQFDLQDFIAIDSDQHLYIRSFHTSFVSIAITTTATISNLTLAVCFEDPDSGATSSTPILQTSHVVSDQSSTSDISTTLDLVSATESAIASSDGSATSTPVIQTSVESQQFLATMTSDIPSTSDIFKSSDLILATETATVSVTPTSTVCTMIEMTDTDASNNATEYSLEGDAACLDLCQHTVQCLHFVYINATSTCKLYDVLSITSLYQENHTLFSKRSCTFGEPCCFDINTNTSSSDEPTLIVSPTADACREFCLAYDNCQASVYTGEKCKILNSPAVTLVRENVVLFMKDCPTNVRSPLTRTDICSDGGNIHPNKMLTLFLAGSIIAFYLDNLLGFDMATVLHLGSFHRH